MTIHKEYISKENTYEGQNSPKYIVIHETDNFSIGADAKRHASAQAAGNLETSVHFYVGSDGICRRRRLGTGPMPLEKSMAGSTALKMQKTGTPLTSKSASTRMGITRKHGSMPKIW